MKSDVLPEDAQTLFALARAIADVLGERQVEAVVEPDMELQLRAGIAAATFARAAYEAVLAGSRESCVAAGFVVQAKHKQHRTEQQLRQHISSVLATFSLLAADDDYSNITEYVLSVSTWPREFSPALQR